MFVIKIFVLFSTLKLHEICLKCIVVNYSDIQKSRASEK